MRSLFWLALIVAVPAFAQLAPLGQAKGRDQGHIVILVGPPGSGKTVQAKRLSQKYKVPAISLADLARTTNSLGAAAASGELFSDESAIQAIAGRVAMPDCGRGFVIDGFPSSEAQAHYLDSFVKSHNLPIPKVVVLDAPDEVLRARLLKRKRADDTPANITRRIAAYRAEVAFLEKWYKPENTVRVDATKTPAEVFTALESGLAESFTNTSFKTRQ